MHIFRTLPSHFTFDVNYYILQLILLYMNTRLFLVVQNAYNVVQLLFFSN